MAVRKKEGEGRSGLCSSLYKLMEKHVPEVTADLRAPRYTSTPCRGRLSASGRLYSGSSVAPGARMSAWPRHSKQ